MLNFSILVRATTVVNSTRCVLYRKHKAFPNQVSLELLCCANTQRTEGNRERPTKVMVEHKLLLKSFFRSLGSSLFSQMLLPPHNYVAYSNNHFVI